MPKMCMENIDTVLYHSANDELKSLRLGARFSLIFFTTAAAATNQLPY